MSSKWKYADLPAQTRLDMLKNGNKDLFDEEVARTKEVMDARREVGLDTDAQEKWIDNVGYNYNLHLAGKAGESPDNVSKTGYANIYYTPKDRSSGGSKIKPNTGRTAIGVAREHIEKAAESASEEIRKKYTLLKEQTREEFSEKSPILREMLINSGASLEGGRAKQFFADIQKNLDSVYDEYDKAMNEELENVGRMYAQMENKLTEYRNSGVYEPSLISVAQELVKGLRQTGKIEYPKLSSLKMETQKSENQEFLPDTVSKENVRTESDRAEAEMPVQADNVYNNEEKSDFEKARSKAMVSILTAMSDLTSENLKRAFEDMGLTKENVNAILKRIREKVTQQMKVD